MKNIHLYKNNKIVNKVFDNVYQNYDLMNDIMSLGTHRLWKQQFINSIDISNSDYIIDMASGTGDISKIILKQNPNQKVLRVEPNKKMLNFSHNNFQKFKHTHSICGYAEEIPLKNNSINKYLISFGLRNVSNLDKSLKECFRVLKKGGGFYCLEFYKVNKPIFKDLYKLYSKAIPLFGKIFNQNSEPYNYLVQSINDFHTQKKIKLKLHETGFKNINIKNIFGGIASIHYAWKLND
tara:strand:- start:1700 stop:2410 length:711 start_codon:yes stop_codon:yes gene_type:complete